MSSHKVERPPIPTITINFFSISLNHPSSSPVNSDFGLKEGNSNNSKILNSHHFAEANYAINKPTL